MHLLSRALERCTLCTRYAEADVLCLDHVSLSMFILSSLILVRFKLSLYKHYIPLGGFMLCQLRSMAWNGLIFIAGFSFLQLWGVAQDAEKQRSWTETRCLYLILVLKNPEVEVCTCFDWVLCPPCLHLSLSLSLSLSLTLSLSLSLFSLSLSLSLSLSRTLSLVLSFTICQKPIEVREALPEKAQKVQRLGLFFTNKDVSMAWLEKWTIEGKPAMCFVSYNCSF